MTRHAIILAAGEAKRFDGKGSKVHAFLVHGVPLSKVIMGSLILGGVEEITVVVGANSKAVAKGYRDLGARIVKCPHWKLGNAISLLYGLQSSDMDDTIVWLGDTFAEPKILTKLLEEKPAYSECCMVATKREPHPTYVYDRPGNDGPVFFRGGSLVRDVGVYRLVGFDRVTCIDYPKEHVAEVFQAFNSIETVDTTKYFSKNINTMADLKLAREWYKKNKHKL